MHRFYHPFHTRRSFEWVVSAVSGYHYARFATSYKASEAEKLRKAESGKSADVRGFGRSSSKHIRASSTFRQHARGRKRKKSKWRLSGRSYSKEKDKEKGKEKQNVSEANTDSAYASSEPGTSANPSFASNPRTVSGEQWLPPPANPLPPPAHPRLPATNLTPPTPPAESSQADLIRPTPPQTVNGNSSSSS